MDKRGDYVAKSKKSLTRETYDLLTAGDIDALNVPTSRCRPRCAIELSILTITLMISFFVGLFIYMLYKRIFGAAARGGSYGSDYASHDRKATP